MGPSPGLAQWVKILAQRRLQMRLRPSFAVAVVWVPALIPPLVWRLPCATGAATNKQKPKHYTRSSHYGAAD